MPRPATDSISLLGVTVRRSVSSGRAYLIYGTGMSLFFGVGLGTAPGAAFGSVFPLFVPFFAVTGALGGMIVFTNDRVKGVLEYLMAYGIPPRRIFVNTLLTSLALASIVLTVALAGGVAAFLARGGALSPDLVVALGLYTVPMTFVSVGFAATTGMYWSALSSPREGLSSPIGLAPLVGLVPSIVTLVLVAGIGASVGLSTTGVVLVLLAAMAIFALIEGLLVAASGRMLRSERLLSPT